MIDDVFASHIGIAPATAVRAVAFDLFLRTLWHDSWISHCQFGLFAVENPEALPHDRSGTHYRIDALRSV
jgi:hypothetical protein